MTYVILGGLVCVLLALAGAGFFMLRKDKSGEARDKRMARALALRVSLSVALFLFILLSYQLGWIHPTGLPVGK